MDARDILNRKRHLPEGVRAHPDISGQYTFVLEYKVTEPSKRSYNTPQEAADIAMRQGLEKHGANLLNVHILKDQQVIDSWKK